MKSSIRCPYCWNEIPKKPKIKCPTCDLEILINEKECTLEVATRVTIVCEVSAKK